jgi:hypothetical protein
VRKSALLVIAAVAALSVVSTAHASTRPPKLVVPGGTPITFIVNDTVTSATAKVGDTFQINAAQDVVINGWIVVAKGAGGQGEVVKVDPAGAHGHAGSLGVQMDWVFAVDGNKIALTSQPKNQQGEGSSGSASTTTVVSYILLGPIGLFAHNFVKGHDVELNTDNTTAHPLSAYVNNSVYVVAQNREMTQPGFAPAAPEATAQPVPPRM